MEEERTQTQTPVRKRRELSGVVVSHKMKDTIVVAVTRYRKHPKYKKYIKKLKKYHAHDVGNKHNVGEKVRILENKPLSKTKHFVVID